jgi:hypothetical protein
MVSQGIGITNYFKSMMIWVEAGEWHIKRSNLTNDHKSIIGELLIIKELTLFYFHKKYFLRNYIA